MGVNQDYVFDITKEPRWEELKCCNNLSRPEEHRMAVQISALSSYDEDSVVRKALKEAGDSKSEGFQERYSTLFVLYRLEASVMDMKNIFFRVDGEIKEIKKVSELFYMKDDNARIVYDEIRRVVVLRTEPNEKN
jgi:hypothetical protein